MLPAPEVYSTSTKLLNFVFGEDGTYFFHLRLNAPAHITQPSHKKGKNSQVNFWKGVTSNRCIG